MTMAQSVNSGFATSRMAAMIAGFFGVLALLIAAVGLYAVVASGVTERTRELGVFMRSMVGFMREACGKPRCELVATFTNIAFPQADVSADDVRAATQPTTRAGRKKGALGPKKGG